MDNSGQQEPTTGKVVERLPNALFKIELDNGEKVLAYLAGKMRMYRIKVLEGDTVHVELDPYGGRARIVRRV